MEVFPLFAAAVVSAEIAQSREAQLIELIQIAGNVAQLPAEDMNAICMSFFAARTIYTGIYMAIKSDTLAYARTGAYAWSISIPIMCLWKAGKCLAVI